MWRLHPINLISLLFSSYLSATNCISGLLMSEGNHTSVADWQSVKTCKGYIIYDSGSTAKVWRWLSLNSPARAVNIYSASRDFVISMCYESPLFFSSKNHSIQQRTVQEVVLYLDITNGKMETDLDNTFVQDLTRTAMFSNLVLGHPFSQPILQV